jgi:hypothetical protein
MATFLHMKKKNFLSKSCRHQKNRYTDHAPYCSPFFFFIRIIIFRYHLLHATFLGPEKACPFAPKVGCKKGLIATVGIIGIFDGMKQRKQAASLGIDGRKGGKEIKNAKVARLRTVGVGNRIDGDDQEIPTTGMPTTTLRKNRSGGTVVGFPPSQVGLP